MNQVILMGHLGADPEFRVYRNGTAMLRLRVATNESYRDKNRECQPQPAPKPGCLREKRLRPSNLPPH